MSELPIEAAGVSKLYKLGGPRPDSIREVLTGLVSPSAERRQTRELWALKDVSFSVRPGETLGMIGENGAGKSTLLKILTGITRPTSGRAVVNGRLGSLLEVGSGFHPELSGRENIFLNGSILGLGKKATMKNFDEIVAFAEIEDFLDTPVKHYSSGMYVRLGFAIAAHLDTDIIIVDEALAVGDAGFQEKSVHKIRELSRSGRTVLFTSHDMSKVEELCDRAMWLRHGEIGYIGDTKEAIAQYLRSVAN